MVESRVLRHPVWPVRVSTLANQLRAAPNRAARDDLLGEVWLLLTAAMDQYARYSGARFGHIDDAERQDIVSEKSLDLIRKLDSGVWRPDDEP